MALSASAYPHTGRSYKRKTEKSLDLFPFLFFLDFSLSDLYSDPTILMFVSGG
jgi:hypothetical protein